MIWVCLILLFHIICCVVAFLGIGCGIFNVHKYMFFVVLFLPMWGFLILLILHFQVAIKADDTKQIPVEKLKLESEIYKSVTVDDKKNADNVIPLEEALIINSAKERRELIMDVLNDNPKEYIEFLQKAGNNDDTEVVHYAVTAMVEISKENDFILQKLEHQYTLDPDNFEILTKYCDFLWSCLEQNLMQGQVEIMNRNHFTSLIKKKLAIEENSDDYVHLIKNCLILKNYTEADAAIEKMEKLFPEDENLLLLRLEYYACLNNGDKIKSLLNKIQTRGVYLSTRAKEAIAFWKD